MGVRPSTVTAASMRMLGEVGRDLFGHGEPTTVLPTRQAAPFDLPIHPAASLGAVARRGLTADAWYSYTYAHLLHLYEIVNIVFLVK